MTNLETGQSVLVKAGLFCNPFAPSSPCYPDKYPALCLAGMPTDVAIKSLVAVGTPICDVYRFPQTPSATPTVTPTHSPTNTPTHSPTFTITNTPTFTPTPTCAGADIPIPTGTYHQETKPWGSQFLDDSNVRIRRSGCFLTCFSMLVQVNPGALNLQLSAYGAINSDGDLDMYRTREFLGWRRAQVQVYSEQTLIDALNRGNYVIAHVPGTRPPGHFILVTGHEFDAATGRCRFTIKNPNGRRAGRYLDEDYNVVFSLRVFEP